MPWWRRQTETQDDGRPDLMACGLALLSDTELERRVDELQESLRAAGIEPETQYPPHVTLWVSAATEVRIAPATASLLEALPPIEVALGSLGCFADEGGVVFLAPLPSAELLNVHAATVAHAQASTIDVDPYYLPDAWVPHCTLATVVDAARMADVVRVVSQVRFPLRGRLVEGALIDGTSGDVIDRRPCSG
ncbi:MAG: uncharacterized protein JWN72_697 [Thermoleophilia bacterium]|nr:uncharacterized protein [Thermoleophilia bacterium]